MAEDIGCRLARILSDNDGGDGKAVAGKQVDKTQDILVVRDAQVSPRLVLLDMVRVDGDDDLDLIGNTFEHAKLGVGLKAGKNAARVVVIKELAAKLQVQLATKLSDTLADMLRLQLDVPAVVKPLTHATGSLHNDMVSYPTGDYSVRGRLFGTTGALMQKRCRSPYRATINL